MEDAQIVALYWQREEAALAESETKYGHYCTSIAANILNDPEDVQECVNDTWLQAWQSIPPHRPERLSVFLGKLTRNLAINRYRRETAQKRGGAGICVPLEELQACAAGGQAEAELERRELAELIQQFLSGLTPVHRNLFLCRYWYFDSIAEIAARFHMTENHVSVALGRLRKKLRIYLNERGRSI